MAYGDAIAATLPTVGVTTGPGYATQINTFLQALQAVVEADVTPAGFTMNADLSFLDGATYRRAKDLLATSYQVQVSPINAATYPAALYFSGGQGNLYANDAAGNQIQITSGGAVNITASGGITGAGYGTGGVEVNWDSGNQAYRMKSGSGANSYADVVCDDLLLNDGSGNFLSVRVAGLAADYTVTWPSAVPATTGTIVQIDTAGNLGFSNTIESLTTSGGGITAATNNDIAVSGTGEYRHGLFQLSLDASAFVPSDPANAERAFNGVLNVGLQQTTATTQVMGANVPLKNGDRIQSVLFTGIHGNSGSTRTYRLVRISFTGSVTVIGTINDTTAGSAGGDTVTVTLSGMTEVVNNTCYQVQVLTSNTDEDGVVNAVVSYDHP